MEKEGKALLQGQLTTLCLSLCWAMQAGAEAGTFTRLLTSLLYRVMPESLPGILQRTGMVLE